ncbi:MULTISPECIES: hypothetical protein [unclassified Streptomyces]|uniref:SCO4225 family membrane protein n=1 Tax=unclassified Streptomyces TaxID=2593676 RepID=UPI002E3808AE|nr:hypothetical protein [Streptomyces sp. NBC_01268]
MATGRLRSVLRLTFGNPASLAYLGLVAAAALFLAYATWIQGDPGFAGIWLFVLTLPTGELLTLPLMLAAGPESEGPPAWLVEALLLVAALIHSFLIGLLYRTVRRPHDRARTA